MSEQERKLYVGNLSYDLTEDELKDFAQEKGIAVESTIIIKDKYSNRSKGFGFVEVASEEDLEKGVEAMNGQQLKGRTLNVSKARPRKERNSYDNDRGSGSQDRWNS